MSRSEARMLGFAPTFPRNLHVLWGYILQRSSDWGGHDQMKYAQCWSRRRSFSSSQLFTVTNVLVVWFFAAFWPCVPILRVLPWQEPSSPDLNPVLLPLPPALLHHFLAFLSDSSGICTFPIREHSQKEKCFKTAAGGQNNTQKRKILDDHLGVRVES